MPLFRRKPKVRGSGDDPAPDVDEIAGGSGRHGEGLSLCAFCADVIKEPPVILHLSFVINDTDQEQMLFAHRRCLTECIADDELFRDGPLFASP